MNGRAALTSDAIVDEALAVIADGGHDRLSMRALATRMGVTAPAFYDHFASRHDLLHACAQAGYDRLAARIDDAPSATPLERACRSARSYVAFASDEPEVFRLMFLFRPESIDASVVEEHHGATVLFDRMVANLAAAIDDGDLAPGDPLDYGLAIWAAVHGVATVAPLMSGIDGDTLTDAVVIPMFRGWAPTD